jgi:hypothetical protein
MAHVLVYIRGRHGLQLLYTPLAMSQISISRSQPQRNFQLALPSPSVAAFKRMDSFEVLTGKGIIVFAFP